MDTSVDLTEEEVRNIIAAFKDMHMKPNAESPDAFKDWMKEFSTQKSLYTGYIPRIPTFSGDNKGDNTYEVWRYQVVCLIIENYADEVIAQAIRRSRRGEPSKIVMRLGPKATVDDIIDKMHMDSIYGIVDPKEALLAQLYTARQEQDEDVSTWGCRLEDISTKHADKERFMTMISQQDCTPDIHGKESIKDPTNISTESVKAICSSIKRPPYIGCLAVTTKDLDSKVDTASIKKIDIREEQLRDPVIRT
ncbi:unnamed protein product [Mytilus edulis]|uniref:Uncharacterized protein n=1 Tax=Mytilus edulis TaxID=6550 RepID=A0A8S3UFZ8_MYTED|nr:unnamed protein product [Mytilus edulis]